MFRRALLATVTAAAVAAPFTPAQAEYAPCGGDVWDCRDKVCAIVTCCFRTTDFYICL